jgi:hypothetical protein
MFSKVMTPLLVLCLVVVSQMLCCCSIVLTSPEPPYTIEPPPHVIDDLQERIATIEADAEGRFSITVTETEMTALAAQMLDEMEGPPPISQPQVYFRNKRVEAYAIVHASDVTDVQGMLAFTIEVKDGEVVVTVEEVDLGPLPIPESLSENLTEAANQALTEWIPSHESNYTITAIEVGNREMTVFGEVRD